MKNNSASQDRRLNRSNRKFLSSTLGVIALVAFSTAFAAGQAGTTQTPGSSTSQPAPEGKSPTASGVKHMPHVSGPIVVNWKIKGKSKEKTIGGVKYESVTSPADVNLTVNPDGSWNFSGHFAEREGHDIDVVVGLKAHDGAIVLFHYCGSMDHGVDFNKQGTSDTLKDDFKSFTPTDWYANYRQPLNSEGIAKRYEEREDRKKRSEEERKKEEEKEKREIAAEVARQRANQNEVASQEQAQQQQQQQSSGGGGGTSFSSVMGDVTSALGTVSSVGQAIAGLF